MNPILRSHSVIALASLLIGCTDTTSDTGTSGYGGSGGDITTTGTTSSTSGGDTVTLRGEVWADNWSALYADGVLVMEDSVSITTERSFNEEIFEFDVTYPVTLAFVIKDYVETDSGLEYIGEPNQQMGDGGYIAQFINVSSGETVAVSSDAFKCFVQYTAPLNKECESDADPDATCQFEILDEPDGWMEPDFDDSQWTAATVFSAAEVDPKDGYDRVSWDSSAQLIWGPDLEADNTILCRYTIDP